MVAAISIQVPASLTFQFDAPADHGFELGQIVVEYVEAEFSKRPGVERVVDEGCGAIEQPRRPMLVQRGGYRHSQREAPKEAGEQSNTVQRRLSPADVDELIAAYCAGTGISELAMRFRLHRTTVAAHLGRHCVKRHGIAKAWTEDVLATAAALYESGRSLATVGAALGVDASTVANRFCTAGVPIRARRGWPQKEPGN